MVSKLKTNKFMDGATFNLSLLMDHFCNHLEMSVVKKKIIILVFLSLIILHPSLHRCPQSIDCNAYINHQTNGFFLTKVFTEFNTDVRIDSEKGCSTLRPKVVHLTTNIKVYRSCLAAQVFKN